MWLLSYLQKCSLASQFATKSGFLVPFGFPFDCQGSEHMALYILIISADIYISDIILRKPQRKHIKNFTLFSADIWLLPLGDYIFFSGFIVKE